MSGSWWSSGDKPRQMEQQGEGRNRPDQKYWWRWEGAGRWGNPQEAGDGQGVFASIVNDPSAEEIEPVLPLGCLQSQRICSLSWLHIQPSGFWSCNLKAASTNRWHVWDYADKERNDSFFIRKNKKKNNWQSVSNETKAPPAKLNDRK